MKNRPKFDLFNPPPQQPLPAAVDVVTMPVPIPGLDYREDFITPEEEDNLLANIAAEPWLGDLKRRVQHYGWKYDYRARSLDYNMYLGPLPVWIEVIADKLIQQGLIKECPDQVIINEYKPGQGIANHVDCEPCFGDTIISLSLGSACTMNFIESLSKQKREVILKPRSVVAISAQARYDWSHGIPARLADEIDGIRVNRSLRISMTFRKTIV
ncbi:alpha-ketoglutarate-dependent dioxygenase AlkB [Pedobacter jeongneungensis]|uniref:alpha-ketoglutarate-dependent dioxygenase AlkB n=1 Tax=Pedobacter jeongneungensis TaxID=947309 RepID=UPI00046A51B3|nr:alpha-ketoglutarate-dependent dioxygenase AlkB [Pedobacter jeongneungensis]